MKKQLLLTFFISAMASCAHPTSGSTTKSPEFRSHGLSRVEDFRQAKAPERDELLRKDAKYTGNMRHRDDGVSIYGIDNQYSGFTLSNAGSPRINPVGLKKAYSGVVRNWEFRFRDLARQDIHMTIEEFPIENGNFSTSHMLSNFYFFPRKFIPSISLNPSRQETEVTLPTGEHVYFSTTNKEIHRGVLREDAPMDYNPNHLKRRFASISYTGTGVMIRVDQLGGMPQRQSPQKFATITQGSRKPCKVTPKELWDQNSDGIYHFLFAKDEDFRQKILVQRCGWQNFKF